jgi:hypothetical protein
MTEHIWSDRRTRHDLPADEVISALQKEIRRGHTENAAFLAYEMLTTSEDSKPHSGSDCKLSVWRMLASGSWMPRC